jgi:hypothetical protein
MILRTPLGDFVVDNETGEATTVVEVLADVAADASAAALGGYIEPWLPPVHVILDWAEREGVPVLRIDEPEPWLPTAPGTVNGSLR